jgi:hypothetical protein
MDDMWMKIGSAILIGMMLVVLFPSAKRMLKESPQANSSQWMSALIPLGLVVGFVVLLMAMM